MCVAGVGDRLLWGGGSRTPLDSSLSKAGRRGGPSSSAVRPPRRQTARTAMDRGVAGFSSPGQSALLTRQRRRSGAVPPFEERPFAAAGPFPSHRLCVCPPPGRSGPDFLLRTPTSAASSSGGGATLAPSGPSRSSSSTRQWRAFAVAGPARQLTGDQGNDVATKEGS